MAGTFAISRLANSKVDTFKDTHLSVALKKSFGSSGRNFSLQAEFSAAPGFTILFGPSGAGKTTLLECVAGLLRPDSGRIAIGSRVFFDASSGTNVSADKRRVGYVLQDLALFPHLTVEQNIEYGLAHLPSTDRKQRGVAMLREFRIEHLHHRFPGQVSGGERQRVALARTLVTEPVVLLLDEPLAALDGATKSKILDDLRAWNQAHRIPILYVTHSREEVLALGDRIFVLESGQIIAQGTPHEVLRAPVQETMAHLAGFENIFSAVVESVHEDRGTLTCRLLKHGDGEHGVVLETPLVRAEIGARLRVGIRAGDILLATSAPVGLSARNIIPGRVISLQKRDMIVTALVDAGVEMEVHLTLAAVDELQLQPGGEVWLVIKTHSCHLMQP